MINIPSSITVLEVLAKAFFFAALFVLTRILHILKGVSIDSYGITLSFWRLFAALNPYSVTCVAIFFIIEKQLEDFRGSIFNEANYS
jgi:hypothetical protein